MLCPNCNEEVLLAETCPYCGAPVPREAFVQEEEGEETSGTFVGPIGSADYQQDSRQYEQRRPNMGRPAKKPGPFSLIRYFFDSSVPSGRKWLILGALLYIISPIDFLPDLMPILGWVDDLAVGSFLWTFISHELARYRNRV